MTESTKPNTDQSWNPPADWRPYTKGNPGRGRVKVVGPDSRSYSRPRTPDEQAAWESRKTGGAKGGESRDIHLTVERLAEALQGYLQVREKFMAVMDEARLSPKAVENLSAWLAEWRAGVAKREIERKESDLRKLQAEILALRRVSRTE